MGHSICALIVGEPFDERAADEWDVAGIALGQGLRLRALGVEAADGLDEFDTVGLADHRRTPRSSEPLRGPLRSAGWLSVTGWG